MFEYFPNTAIMRSSFEFDIPRVDLFGYPNFVYVVRDSVSMTRGRFPSIVIERLEPIPPVVSEINSSPGFLTSASHDSSILKRAISLVAQNLFLSPRSILRSSNLSP